MFDINPQIKIENQVSSNVIKENGKSITTESSIINRSAIINDTIINKEVKNSSSKNGLLSYFNMEIIHDSPIANALGLLLITLGGSFSCGALFLLITPQLLPVKISGLSFASQIILNILDIMPGILFPIIDISSYDLFTISIVSLIISGNLILLGLGIIRKSNTARWSLVFIFILSFVFDFITFISKGLLGAPTSVLGIGLNIVFLTVLVRNKYWV
jgi:hypothetical protein